MKSFLLCLLLIILPKQVFSENSVRLANGEWPPYLSRNLSDFGAASHIVTEAFKAVGVKVEYEFLPWKRAYKYAVSGQGERKTWHGTLVWVYTEERAKFFDYSDVVLEDEEVLFHLRETLLPWKNILDLQGMQIGGTSHTVYPLFEEAEEKGVLKIHRAGNYETLFLRLLSGRIDAVPLVKYVGDYFLNTNLTPQQRSKITYAPTVVDYRKYHVIFSKNISGSKEKVKLFNEGLKKIRENGTYDRILDNLKKGTYYGRPSQDSKLQGAW